MPEAEHIKISSTTIEAVFDDPKKTAHAIKLVYMQDSKPGISRRKQGNNFYYYLDGKKIRDDSTLDRIKKLVIPPAWENVWICPKENGHLQATGFDSKNRKQYRYHRLWNSFRNQTKFYRLYKFGKTIPAIRKQVKKDLEKSGLPVEKVLAAVICLMEQTSIRIGNSNYEKLYGSYGLSTLKDKHVQINKDKMQFTFTGKKGISHNISIKNRKLASVVKQCRDIPGKELFQYYDENGNHKAIDSGMVNDYIKSITGQDFTTKDFHTWIGTTQALCAFKNMTAATSKKQIQKNIICVLNNVAKHLGNTPAVCKKYYVHPVILNLYACNKLGNFFMDSEKIEKSLKKLTLDDEERLLLHILAQKDQIEPAKAA